MLEFEYWLAYLQRYDIKKGRFPKQKRASVYSFPHRLKSKENKLLLVQDLMT